METWCLLPVFLFISPGFRIQQFIPLILNKCSIGSKIDFIEFSSHDLNFKDRNLQERGIHCQQIIILNCSKYLCVLQSGHYVINDEKQNKQYSLCLICLLKYLLTFLFFFHCRLMTKKCMAANISGLFQGGMKTFGGNPGLIPHSVSAKIFLQPWKVILEWILSLSVQK